MPSKLITQPTYYPVTLNDLVKVQIKVDGTDEDTLLEAYIAAATQFVENFTGLQLMQAVWEWHQNSWYSEYKKLPDTRYYCRDDYSTTVKLPYEPLVKVNSIKYDDVNNVEQTLDTSVYQVNTLTTPGYVNFIGTLPSTYDKPNAIRINYTAGYGIDGDDIPEQQLAVPSLAKFGILRTVADMDANRQDETQGIQMVGLKKDVEYFLSTIRVKY